MTAGAGVLHEEFHSPEFAEHGGLFEMVQLYATRNFDSFKLQTAVSVLRRVDFDLNYLVFIVNFAKRKPLLSR